MVALADISSKMVALADISSKKTPSVSWILRYGSKLAASNRVLNTSLR